MALLHPRTAGGFGGGLEDARPRGRSYQDHQERWVPARGIARWEAGLLRQNRLPRPLEQPYRGWTGTPYSGLGHADALDGHFERDLLLRISGGAEHTEIGQIL